jgi:hypothetical protein
MDKSNSKYEWNYSEAIAAAEKSGFEVVRSAEDRLLVDIDDTESLRHFKSAFAILKGHFVLKEVTRWRSKSGEGWHIVLSCKPCDFIMRVALQACLGSDRKREALALMMAADGEKDPSFLFKPPTSST